ncbi:hypothetical protein FNQ90_20100, partial [Streptomyces alkaliphilus]|nr:hypothetical protein [Streptomyces alkaliphilus]
MTADTSRATGDPTGSDDSYPAARLRILGGDGPTGAPRRAELSRATDRWLADLLNAPTPE